MLSRKKAQSLVELALLLGLIAAGIMGMQVYVKRALQARYKAIVDASGDVYRLRQYEPYYNSSNFITEKNSEMRQAQAQGGIRREVDDLTNRQGSQKTGTDLKKDGGWNW